MSVDPTSNGEGYSAVLYDNTNGLPTSEANAIAETSEGFIWIGSYSGLIRYDGNNFERIASTTGISSVVSLFVDSRDRLWIGTNDSGVAVMEKGEFTLFDIDDGLPSSAVRSIVEDVDGDIYIATAHGICIIGNDMKVRDLDEVQVKGLYIDEIRITDGGVIYGKTSDGNIFTIENDRLSGFYSGYNLGIDNINCVFPDPDREGYVYLGTEESQIYHGRLAGTLLEVEKIDAKPLKSIYSLEKFQDQVWICSDNGVGLIDSEGVHKLENLPMDNSIEHTMVDYEGNIWFTSSRQGVMKIVPNHFTDIFNKYKLDSAVVNATCFSSNTLFIGTDKGLIALGENSVIDDVPISFSNPEDKFSSYTNLVQLLDGCRIRSVIRDSKNRIWFSTYSDRALICYDKGVITRFNEDMGLPSNRVRTVKERSDGVIMAAVSGGLVLIDNDKIIDKYDKISGLDNTEILSVAQADNGDMIIGTDGSGIFIIDGHAIRNIGKKDGLKSEVVMRVKRDRTRNIYWIVTSNSIAYMTADYEIHTIEGFPYTNNFDLYENSQDEMWVLSSNGIYVIPVETMIKNEIIEPVYFSRSNGLSCIATANAYSELTESGDLYIAGTTGISKVNIENAFLNVDNIKMAVPYVSADGVMIYPDSDGKITIPHDTSRLTIYPFVYTYALTNPKITYWLEGFDEERTTVNRDKMEPLNYTNLAGGTYSLHMVMQDPLGKGGKEISVKIAKKMIFYETKWFLCLVGVIIIIIGYLIIRLVVKHKTKRLLKKEKENRELIKEITQAFAKTIDLKDKYTNGHSQRVADYTAMLAKELGYSEEEVEKYYNIALLHDIGKISIPSEVLNKEGKLTDQEFNIIKSHSARGYQVLKDISIMPELAIGAGAHHERPDGKGYPKGLKDEDIPRVAQIIAVADTFDAMYSDRPYRKRMNFEKVVSIIKEVSGTQLTADVVDAFLRIVENGGFRAPDDNGGGTTEDIDNIHKKQQAAEAKEK
ncbi:MAG: HD domain-containing protein [Lachnospiraceae bacterium]|nr:HD domain-containing protein [Lachnospiraceae bacterium]